jgi:dTDP-3-amino-3,4,6-trideoxy-alpha-D-glucose transaminase
VKAIPFLDVAATNRTISGELAAAARDVIDENDLILGPEVALFEREFAAFCGAQFCVGVGSGLDALTLMLRAYNVGEGEVIVASNTFIATWLAVTAARARPVPVEPDADGMNMDPARVRAAVGAQTRAILVTHLYGARADMEALFRIADYFGLPLLVDAAQAHGITTDGSGLGDAAAFSFYPTKNLGALGDGGAVVTSHGEIARRVTMLRNYGTTRKDVHATKGVNSRLDEIQAAMLRVKLRRLREWNAVRARNAAIYESELSGVQGIALPSRAYPSVWHIYAVRLWARDAVRASMAQAGIGTAVHYPTPPHKQEAYAGTCGVQPIAESLAERVLSLPIGPELSEEDVRRVAAAVRDAVELTRRRAA